MLGWSRQHHGMTGPFHARAREVDLSLLSAVQMRTWLAWQCRVAVQYHVCFFVKLECVCSLSRAHSPQCGHHSVSIVLRH